ncbi:hypothetical protein J437_LFUL000965 [Ladona fulva]|uniref:Cytochrome P450 n=1 Tax=Ladona fulva TaxID=123851 RepID=A0A8K0KIV3_LADFU|nr:hypothetical protein J437_LFUL000965 [Ladona fulva]
MQYLRDISIPRQTRSMRIPGPKWHSRRKLLTPAFHRSILESFQEVFEEKSEVLVRKLARMCKEGQVFNIETYIAQSSLDVICETAMGTKMRIQEEVTLEEAKYLEAKNSAAEITTYRFLRPWLHPDFIFNMTPKGWKFNQSVKMMHDFTNKVTNYEDDAEVRPKKRKAFMDILIEASYADGPENKPFLSDLDIREEVDTFMFEGHDTTASSISWTLYLLGRHPDIQERVWQEVDEVLGDERISSMQKLTELRLLDRCIRESLRLYPSVPLIARKLREDVKLGDYIAPAGSEVFIHLILAHRDPDIFPEPDKFDPDNFLPENCEKRPPFAFVPFSAGSRNCIGQKFALQEMKTVLATILRNYRLESTDAPENLTVIPELVLRSKEGINVLLHPRK